MKKFLMFSGLLGVIVFVSLSSYYLRVVLSAREYTTQCILIYLHNSQWKQMNGIARSFEIYGHDLSERQREILIKVQDPGFYGHRGIDLSTPGAGLTTITQAIVKKLYFDNFKSGSAKIKQSLIARFVVHDLISKEDQLTLFINMMYFGRVDGKVIVGLQSAAQAYYRLPVSKLSEEQFISLIAMIIMPETFHILNHPEWNKDRTIRIKALVDGNYIPKGLMDQYYGELPREVIDHGLPKASYFADLYKD